eukprot:Tbor_TRINITY_DN2338_c0_g1::TRINITY_DN2338_c0_g1_i1::g.201::m.201
MVFYFTLRSNPAVTCYMGRDKYENEDLIRWGWPEDIWFHVDSHSSAHIYVRMPTGQGMDDLSPETIEECCQLTKQNSIEGCKLSNVKIVYTPWSNLKKTNGMDVGQVSFHSDKLRRYYTVEKKDGTILNPLEKSKIEKNNVDFRLEREIRDQAEAKKEKIKKQKAAEEEQCKIAAQKEADDIRKYVGLHDEENLHGGIVPDEDDFM